MVTVGIFDHANSNLRSMMTQLKEHLYATTFVKQVIMAQMQYAAGSIEGIQEAFYENLLKIQIKGFLFCQ